MSDFIQILDITNANGEILSPEWMERSQQIHRQLRPQLPNDYMNKMRRVFAGGARMSIAVKGDDVVGVAVYRVYENTASGVHMYVDDLVTDENRRSLGIGKELMNHLKRVAQDQNCETFNLDSATYRQQAHKFYFREGMVIVAFHFAKPLNEKAQ